MRRAGFDDVAAMATLKRAAFAEALVPLLPETFELTPVEEARARIGEALASDGVRALVIDGEHGVEGLVVYGLNRDVEPIAGAGEIRALFVHPPSWRSGLGRALVERACTELADMGYSSASLWSLRDNAGANAFYERLGFERDGATQVRPALGASEVRYARFLRRDPGAAPPRPVPAPR